MRKQEITLKAPKNYYRTFIQTVLQALIEDEAFDYSAFEEMDPQDLLVYVIEKIYALGWMIVKEPKIRKKKVEST